MDLWNLVLLICFFFFYVEASRPAIEEDAQQEKTHMDSATDRIGHPKHLLALPEEVRERIKLVHSTPKLHYSSDSKKGIFVRNLEDKDIPALWDGIDEMRQNARLAQVATKTAHDQLDHLKGSIQEVGKGLDYLNGTTKWLDPLMRIKYMKLEPDRMGAFNLPYNAEYWADVAAHVPQDDPSLNISGMASAHPSQVISTSHHQGACKQEAEPCQRSPDNCCDDLTCQEFDGLFMACEKAPVAHVASAMTEVAALTKDKSSALLQRQTDVSPRDVDRRFEAVRQSTERDLEDEISTQKDVELLKASIDAERRPGTRRGGEQRQSGTLSFDRDSGVLVGASSMSIDQPIQREFLYSNHDRKLLSGARGDSSMSIDQPRQRGILYSDRDEELLSGARRDSNMSMRVEQSQRGGPSSDHDRGVVLSAPSTGRGTLAQPVVEQRFQEQRGGSRMHSAELSSGSNPVESSQLLSSDVTSQDAMTGGLRAEDLVKLKELEEENDIDSLTDFRELGELRELYRPFTGLTADELVTLKRLEEEKELRALNFSMPEQRTLDLLTGEYRAGLDQLIAQEPRNLNRSLSEPSALNLSSSVNMLGTSGRLSVASNTEPLSLSGLSGLPERQTATTGIMLSGAGQRASKKKAATSDIILSDADQRASGLEAGRNAARLSEADQQALDLEAMRNAALEKTASGALEMGIPLSKAERETMSHDLALEAKKKAVLETRAPKRETAGNIIYPVVDRRELDLEEGRNPDLERTSLEFEEPQSGTMLSGAQMDLETRRKTSLDALSDAHQHVLELRARRNSARGGSVPLRPPSRFESLESLETSKEREQPVSRFEEFRKTGDSEDLRRDAAELHQDELEEGMRTLDPLEYFNNTHKATWGWDAVGLDNRDRANYTGDEVRAFHEKISEHHDEVNELARTLDKLSSMWRPAAQAGFNQILKDEGQRTDAFKEVPEVEPQGEYNRYEARGKQITVRVKTNLGELTP